MSFIPLIKLIIIIAIIIIGLRLKVSLGPMLGIASILLAVIFRVPIDITLVTFLDALTNSLTLQIIGILILIMILEYIMTDQGTMDLIVEGVNISIKNPMLSLAILPILVGILPSPGGALFSCPLLEKISKQMDLSAEVKGFVNYWFRHIWEYSCPLYPGIILTAGIVGMPLFKLIPYMIPISIMQALVGSIVLWKIGGVKLSKSETKEGSNHSGWIIILKGIAPILATIALVVFFKLTPVISLLFVVIVLILTKNYRFKDVIQIFKTINKQIIISVIGVMLFKDMLIASGVPEELPEILIKLELPTLFIVAVLPFLIGILMGLTPGMVGVSFPLILSFYGRTMEPASIVLAFACGFAGLMVTPLHICFIISVDYFKAKFSTVFRWVICSEAVIVAFAFLLYYIY